MRYVSLFSGIEAASVAWEPLGWEPVAFSEIEPYCCRLLAKRWPNVPNLGDITKIDWEKFKDEFGAIDVMVGGSPCQSFSIAGNRTGLCGASGLMWEYVRAVSAIRPRWAVWENVPGCLSSGPDKSTRGEDFGCLLRALDEIGYCCAWRVLDAQFFGVAQRRERVFLIANVRAESAAQVLFEPEGMRGDPESSREKRKELAAAVGNGNTGVHSYTLKLRHTGSPNRGGGSGPLVQKDVSATLATAQDQTIIHQTAYSRAGSPRAAGDASKYENTELANTLNCFDIGDIRTNEVVAMETMGGQDNLLHMADTQANAAIGTDADALGTLSVHSAKDPAVVCLQTGGGNPAGPVVIDRAAFNQGRNAKFAPHIEQTELMDTLVSRGPHAVMLREETE